MEVQTRYGTKRYLPRGSRSRSRSRSRSVSSVRAAYVAVPRRSIRYNGVNKISRICQHTMNFAHHDQVIGYQIGASSSARSFGITFYPGSVVISSGVYSDTIAVSSYSELSNLYDFVKIDKVVMELSTNFTSSSTAYLPTATTNLSNPRLLICNDDNDVTAFDTIREIDGVKALDFTDKNLRKWIVYPKFQAEVYKTSTSVGMSAKRGFITSSDDVPHFGTKVYLNDNTYTAPHHLYLTFKYFYTLKNVK